MKNTGKDTTITPLVVRLSPEDDEKLRRLAEHTQRNRSNLIRVLLSLAEPGPRRTIVFEGDEAAQTRNGTVGLGQSARSDK